MINSKSKIKGIHEKTRLHVTRIHEIHKVSLRNGVKTPKSIAERVFIVKDEQNIYNQQK